MELLVPQAELALAFTSNVTFSRVSHSSPKTNLLTVRPAMATAFVSPVVRSLVQDGQIVASKERTSRLLMPVWNGREDVR